MTWFKVDDNFPTHHKVLAIPRRQRTAAIGLWTLAGAWCAKNLTDGYLGDHMIEELASSRKHADMLVQVGLWEKTDNGYLFHDWSSPWQPTRSEVEAKRKEEADRKAAWRAKRAADRAAAGNAGPDPDDTWTDDDVPLGRPPDETRDTHVSPTDVPVGVRTHPNQTRTRPDPVSPKGDTPSLRSGAAQKRATTTPDRFEIDDDLRTWAAGKGLDGAALERETERFLDHHRAKGSAFKDWRAAWRTWIGRVEQYAPATVHRLPGTQRPGYVTGHRDDGQIPHWEL